MQFHRTSNKCALIGAGMAALALAGCGADAQAPPAQTDAAITKRQAEVFVAALKPRRAGRAVIAIVALSDGTEITDLMLPHAVLRRADVADVQIVATRRGPVSLYPALQVEAAHDFASFDQAYPSGADYVIVPAMQDENDPAITTWLKQQHARGTRVIGVCAGALVVANAGLLDGRRFVTHWYSVSKIAERHPTAVYVPNQRYVIDRDVATTSGITASVPTMLALVEAIGGREKAQALAAEMGVASWTPAHDSSLFGLDARRRWNFVMNKIAFWRDERWSVDVSEGMDDIALALTADAWSRTGHVNVDASAAGPVKLRSGLLLAAQPSAQDTPRLPLAPALKPMQQLDRTLCEIGERFGIERLEWVMMELEYAGSAASACAKG